MFSNIAQVVLSSYKNGELTHDTVIQGTEALNTWLKMSE